MPLPRGQGKAMPLPRGQGKTMPLAIVMVCWEALRSEKVSISICALCGVRAIASINTVESVHAMSMDRIVLLPSVIVASPRLQSGRPNSYR